MKKAKNPTADNLVKAAKIVFTEFALCNKIISGAGMNFTSDTFRQFCRQMNIEHAITSSYHHQSSGKV